MTQKISLTLNAKRYDIDVEEGFADFLLSQMEEDFHVQGNNDLKALLHAYVRKNFYLYRQKQEMDKMVSLLESTLKNTP